MEYIKQNLGKPHFEQMLWSKPETKALAGKLLIIGGNKFGINAPSEAYGLALKSGAGEVRAVLPDSTKKLFGGAAPQGIEFAKSAPSGSFSKDSITELLAYIDWADLVLLAGDFSRSSETGILIEDLLTKTDKNYVLTRDALDYFAKNGNILLNRPNTTVVASFAQLQSLLASAKYPIALTFGMPNNILIEFLDAVGKKYVANIVSARHNYIYTVSEGRLCVTDCKKEIDSWRLSAAVKASVWLMQNPTKAFEALATSSAID